MKNLPSSSSNHTSLSLSNKTLIIIAHPDDELFFCGTYILQNPHQCHVICCTNKYSKARRHRFNQVASHLNFSYEILDLPDTHSPEVWSNHQYLSLSSHLFSLIKQDWSTIISHGLYGEYGHPVHIAISFLVRKHCLSLNKPYTEFSPTSHPVELNENEIVLLSTAFDIYCFGRFSFLADKAKSGGWFIRFLLGCYNQFTLYSFYSPKKHIRLLLGRFANPSSDPCYSSFINGNLKYFNSLNHYQPKVCAQTLRLDKSNLPLSSLQSIISIYSKYPERFLILSDFLSGCSSILNVGVNWYNFYDPYFLPPGTLLHTIDIDEKNESFGSPCFHETCNFLDFSTNVKYDAVVLSGLFREPHKRNAHYNLHDFVLSTVQKAVSLSSQHSRLLLGLEYLQSSSMCYLETELTNAILSFNYSLEMSYDGVGNRILVFQRNP